MEKYIEIGSIGQGNQSHLVSLVKDLDTNKNYAMKTILLSNSKSNQTLEHISEVRNII